MKKLAVVVLIVFIIVIFGSIAIRYFANAPEQDNWFNRDYRAKLSRYPFLRTVYGLHWDGDAASDYVDGRTYTDMDIVFNRYDECAIPTGVMEAVRQEVENVVDKSGQVRAVDGGIYVLTQDSYDRTGLHAIASHYRQFHTSGHTAVLNVYCVNAYTEQPSNVGLTTNEDGVVVFYETLKRDVGDDTDALSTYFISTVLHEFGHQIGLSHGNDPTCLMAEMVEVSGDLDPRLASFTPVTFCPAEIEQIEKIRQSYYTAIR